MRRRLFETIACPSRNEGSVMSESWDESRCNDRSGFLFSHDCLQMPANHCSVCQRPICEDHTRYDAEQLPQCVTCAKQRPPETSENDDLNPSGSGYRQSSWGASDPYFYAGHHYSGWGRHRGHATPASDPNDFTAGDAMSLNDDDSGDFESNLSES